MERIGGMGLAQYKKELGSNWNFTTAVAIQPPYTAD